MSHTPIDDIGALHIEISSKLCSLGRETPYAADANEPDPRYLGYGVRAPEIKRFLVDMKSKFSAFNEEQKIELAARLIASGYGEQKSVAIALLETVPEQFTPERFNLLEDLVNGLHGWSKIDSITKYFLPRILENYERETVELLGRWNISDDQWLRRASVVIFTRNVAKTGSFKDIALHHCDSLVHDTAHLVQTGVGWCLRDLMRWHKDDILPYVLNLRCLGVSSKITLYALRDLKGAERKFVLQSSK